MKTKPIKQNLDYHFTPDELIAMGRELGERQLRLRKLDDDRKMVADEWKAKISAEENAVNNLANKVSSGYEYRDIECTVTFNVPGDGQKTITRNDTGSLVRTLDMEEHEKQEELPLQELQESSSPFILPSEQKP